ncbi:MAG: hypothetical protein ACTSWF_05435, partial [Candidatus Freyarchaeota archaeon]
KHSPLHPQKTHQASPLLERGNTEKKRGEGGGPAPAERRPPETPETGKTPPGEARSCNPPQKTQEK